jgi:hypothetical protein
VEAAVTYKKVPPKVPAEPEVVVLVHKVVKVLTEQPTLVEAGVADNTLALVVLVDRVLL